MMIIFIWIEIAKKLKRHLVPGHDLGREHYNGCPGPERPRVSIPILLLDGKVIRFSL